MQEFHYFKVDDDKKKNGVWVDHPSGRFLIGSPDPLDVTTLLESKVAKIQRLNTTKSDPTGKKYKLSNTEQMRCNAEVMAQLQLLDWEIEGIEYSKERAVDAIISDREYTDSLPEFDENGDKKDDYISLMKFINIESNKLSNYEIQKRKENAKK